MCILYTLFKRSNNSEAMFKLKFKTFKNSRLLSKISNSYLNTFSESFIHHLNALVFASVEITPTGRVEKVWFKILLIFIFFLMLQPRASSFS